MISLPVIQSLDVEGYGMFPGKGSKPGLHISFSPGLTLVLGANGLGKSTLVTLLYRMLTGPFEVPGLASPGSLGSARLDATRLQRWDQRVLAARVVDEARHATAHLEFSLGMVTVSLVRSLATLAVVSLEVEGEDVQATDDRYQQAISELSGVPTFGDWILLLRYLTFYFEERRALVWDPTAQKQVLRLLMLPSDTAASWATRERGVLELDSRVRNLQATLNREEGMERRARAKAADSQTLLARITILERELRELTPLLDKINTDLPASDADRQRARLRALTTEQERDAAYRALERLQLNRIADSFPSHAETARYLISRLLSTEICQTCGSVVPEFAAELEGRLSRAQCIVCSTNLEGRARGSRAVEREIAERTKELVALENALRHAVTTRDEAEQLYESMVTEFRRLEAGVSERRARIAAMIRQLPSSEREVKQHSDEVLSLHGHLEALRQELTMSRTTFERLVQEDLRTISEQRAPVIQAFQVFAEGFLFESCRLNWAPYKDRVGQTGPTMDFPAFEFEMSGSDFPTPVRRSGPEQVSESQREFIDLAFRMTLMKVATTDGVGSLVIDAPESSLDAVFSERAAKVLTTFGSPQSGNRLLITSNLVDGQLIPAMLRDAKIRSPRSKRIVDLLEIATPTTATRELAREYRRVRDRLFVSSKDGA